MNHQDTKARRQDYQFENNSYLCASVVHLLTAMPSLQFKGKVFVQNHHLVVPFHELLPVKSRGLSQKASLHDNLIGERRLV